jgi:type IV secretory pathway TrbF-like protein
MLLVIWSFVFTGTSPMMYRVVWIEAHEELEGSLLCAVKMNASLHLVAGEMYNDFEMLRAAPTGSDISSC